MAKSISEMYNEMKGIKTEPKVEQPKKPAIPLPETIEHKNDPLVQMFLEQRKAKHPKKKTDAEKEKVKLGVKTPVDLKPKTKDELPYDSAAPKIREGFWSGLGAAAGAVAATGAGFVGGAVSGALGQEPHHNEFGSIYHKIRSLIGKKKKKLQFKPKKDLMSAPVQPKPKKKTKAEIEQEKYVKGYHDWLMKDYGKKNEETLQEKKHVNPQVKYGGPWRDSVLKINDMNRNIGMMQIKHLTSIGKNRVFIANVLKKAKKERDKAIEDHHSKFPIREGTYPIREGRMKEWLMDMEDHVADLHRKHKGDRKKMKTEFLKKYPNQERVFHAAASAYDADDAPVIPGYRSSRVESYLQKVAKTIVEDKKKESRLTIEEIDAILDRLAMFGFYPAGLWPTPEMREELAKYDESNET